MSSAGDFYLAQARICASAARTTDLPMLREKYEGAEAAWQALARRESDIAAARERRLAEAPAKGEA